MPATMADARSFAQRHAELRRPILALGAAMAGVALAAVVFPAETALTVGAATGWLLWFAGGLMLGYSVMILAGRLRWTGVAAALVAAGAGAYLTFHPTVGAVAAALLLAGVFIVDGSFQLALALKLWPLKVWRWMLASALASLIAAGLLAAGLPTQLPQALAFILCAAFLSTAAALIVLGLGRPQKDR